MAIAMVVSSRLCLIVVISSHLYLFFIITLLQLFLSCNHNLSILLFLYYLSIYVTTFHLLFLYPILTYHLYQPLFVL